VDESMLSAALLATSPRSNLLGGERCQPEGQVGIQTCLSCLDHVAKNASLRP
jgi:hypothetical protein